MSYLNDKITEAQGLLGRGPVRATETDAVKHDSFDAAMYRELLDEAPALSELAYEDLGQHYDYTEDMVREVVMSFWQGDPTMRSSKEMHPSFLLNYGVADDILKAPETPHTRTFTKHDRYGAAMATIAVTEKIKDYLERAKEAQEKAEEAAEQQQALEQAMKNLAEMLAGLSPPGESSAPGEGDEEGGCALGGASGPLSDQEGPLTEQQQIDLDALVAAIEAAQQADITYEQTLGEAQEEAERVSKGMSLPIREAVEAAGDMLADEADLFATWGVEDGILKRLSFEERQRLASALRRNRLNEFRKLIGRFRVMGEAQRSKKVEYARDEAYDVELSDRLPDVLASEFAMLTNEHTRLDFLERLAESQLLSKKYRGIEKIGQGSIICLVDNSGSMAVGAASRDRSGLSREAFAKAFALALLDQARAADRDFVGINFSSSNQISVFRFPKGKGDINLVLQFIEEFFGGGTDFMQPLDLAVDILEAEFNDAGLMRADLVMITDDDCRVTPQWLAKYQTRKEKLGFRTFGVAVGTNAGNALASLSDNVRSVFEFADPMQVADIMRVV